MIIDAHTHLKHGDAPKTEFTPEEIIEVMDATGMDKAITMAMCTTTRRSIEMALEAVSKFPQRFIPFVYALPSFEKVVIEEIKEAIFDLGFKGIKIHAGEYVLEDYLIDPVMKFANEHALPCLIDFMGRVNNLEHLARSFPQARIIVAHIGQYMCTDGELMDEFIRMAEKHPNVYIDISGVALAEKITEAVRRIGAGRVIFGTDGPQKVPTTIEFAKREIEKVKELPLSEEEKGLVLGGSISALLGI